MNKEVISLKENVVGAIREEMKKSGAVESYYNKITGGTGACVTPETRITVEDGGYTSAEDIKVGDYVLTRRGRLRKVIEVMSREVNEDIYEIKIVGLSKKLSVTKEHSVLIRRRIPKKWPRSHSRTEFIEKAEWVEAQYINEKDVAHTPTFNPDATTEEMDEETAFMLGIYCAEGFLSGTANPRTEWKGHYNQTIPNGMLRAKPNNGYNTNFVLHFEKDTRLRHAIENYAKRLGAEFKTRSCESSEKTIKLIINYRPFAKLCEKHVGKGSKTKRLSKDLMTAAVSIQKAFLAGFILGDGYVDKGGLTGKWNRKRIVATTSSGQLAAQLFWMAERCGMVMTLSEGPNRGGPQYRDRKGLWQWKMRLPQAQARKLGDWLKEDFGGKIVRGVRFASAACTYGKIAKVERKHYCGKVYNFEVEEDNSYVANLCTVHNCEAVETAFVLADLPDIAFLSQTDQLHMEAEILEHNIPAIWTLGRSYRKEPRAGDGRHLSEFALLEYEARDMDLAGLTKFQQKLLDIAMKVALESAGVGTKHKKRLERFLSKPAPVITYTEILERLNDGGVSINWGDDFSSTIEEMVCLIYDGPVQVTHYPESIKFFNMYRTNRKPLPQGLTIDEYNENRWTVSCCDMLLSFAGETFGSSRREENYETLTIKLVESSMFAQMTEARRKYEGHKYETEEQLQEAALQPFKGYLELFNPKNASRKGVMRSGFGLGMGRLIQFLLGSTEIVVF